MARRQVSPKSDTTKNCWEFWRCGRQPGNHKMHALGVCPAATAVECDGINQGTNGGRFCWFVAGTLCCRGEVAGMFAWKFGDCLQCDFYRSVEKQEGSSFVAEPVAKKPRRTLQAGGRKTG